MMAPPTPVPMATMRALRLPRAAPKRASAHPKALASFSTTTGRPTPSETTSPIRIPVQSRLVPCAIVLRSEDTKPAAPMPTVATSGKSSRSRRTTIVIVSMIAWRSAAGESRRIV